MNNEAPTGSDAESHESDSIEEIITVRPLPTPRLTTVPMPNSCSGMVWSNDSARDMPSQPSSSREPMVLESFIIVTKLPDLASGEAFQSLLKRRKGKEENR